MKSHEDTVIDMVNENHRRYEWNKLQQENQTETESPSRIEKTAQVKKTGKFNKGVATILLAAGVLVASSTIGAAFDHSNEKALARAQSDNIKKVATEYNVDPESFECDFDGGGYGIIRGSINGVEFEAETNAIELDEAGRQDFDSGVRRIKASYKEGDKTITTEVVVKDGATISLGEAFERVGIKKQP